MQGIRHQDSIKQGQVDFIGEISWDEMQILNASKSGPMSLLQGIQFCLILIDGVDVRAGAEQLSQGQGKRAGTSTQVREGGAKRQIRWAQKVYMVMMVHFENGITFKLARLILTKPCSCIMIAYKGWRTCTQTIQQRDNFKTPDMSI